MSGSDSFLSAGSLSLLQPTAQTRPAHCPPVLAFCLLPSHCDSPVCAACRLPGVAWQGHFSCCGCPGSTPRPAGTQPALQAMLGLSSVWMLQGPRPGSPRWCFWSEQCQRPGSPGSGHRAALSPGDSVIRNAATDSCSGPGVCRLRLHCRDLSRDPWPPSTPAFDPTPALAVMATLGSQNWG